LIRKCGDKSQHIRLRWVQSKEQKLNKPRSLTSPTDERYNAKIDSMQITSKAQMVSYR
jgi:hypothetical protein